MERRIIFLTTIFSGLLIWEKLRDQRHVVVLLCMQNLINET